ncbi:MAG: FAD-dependent oxidoreductase [Planctomycetota bacterium]|nr:FAD-dependent oxidoreductase [Planctomycetota bacterium]
MERSNCEVLIIGGGISGTSLLYLLSRFTDLRSLCLIEKYDHLDPLNSNAHNNSQTLHEGDIETNYSLEKATHVKAASGLTKTFAQRVLQDDSVIRCYGKMLLGVGDEEVEKVTRRHAEFKDLFPTIELLDASGIADLEPKVALVDGSLREDPIAAIHNPEGYAVDYGKVTEGYVAEAKKAEGTEVAIQQSTEAKKINRVDGGYEVECADRTIHAKLVVVSAGAHSLLMAQKMGYGHNLSVMPVTGSFYFAPKVLDRKVYTVQNDKLPFAAIHGDPDLTAPDKTRFGPTALVLPVLERHNAKTAWGFLESFNFDDDVAAVLWELMKDKDIHNFVYRNLGYELPYFGKRSFLKAARKIIPSMEAHDLEFAEGYTGIRPQLIEKKERRLMMGAAKIDEGDGIIFNMTPSPGATSALDNARVDMNSIARQLGSTIDETGFQSLFGEPASGPEVTTTSVGHM